MMIQTLRNEKVRNKKVLSLSLALSCLSAGPVLAADGDLDTSFSGDGKATVHASTGYNDLVGDVMVLLDGSVLLAGSMMHSPTDADFLVTKLTAQGSLDTSFGNNGHAVVAFDLGGGLADWGHALARQGDGKLVVGGWVQRDSAGNYDFAAVRLHADGTIDTGFGTAGKVTVAFDLGGVNFESVADVLIQPDGKILLAGTVQRANQDEDFAVVRLLADGTPDASFGYQGKVVAHFDQGGDNRDTVKAAVLQTDGKILLAGTVERAGLDFDFAALRLLANGSVDSSYGTVGRVTVGFNIGTPGQDFARDAVLDAYGRLVMAGHASGIGPGGTDFAVVRLDTNGTPDISFDGDGKVTVGINLGLGSDIGNAVAAAPDDKIIVAGDAWVSETDADFAVVRLNPDGSLDSGFGSSGKRIVAFDLGSTSRLDRPEAATIGIDGGIVVAGTVDTINDLALTGVIRLQGAPWFVF